MSRYQVAAKDPEKYAITIGWDTPLQTYFAQVVRKDTDRDWDMALWAGTHPRELHSVAELQETIKPYADIPRETQNALACDQGPMEHWAATERGRGSDPGR